MSAAPTLLIDGREIDLARLADICLRFGVAELAAFGSTARNETTRDSDVDLLYVMAPGRRLGFAIDQLGDELAELFGRKVDLVSKASLHPLLRDDVLGEARTLVRERWSWTSQTVARANGVVAATHPARQFEVLAMRSISRMSSFHSGGSPARGPHESQ